MKKIVLISAIAMSGLFYNTADAQISIHFGIHLFPRRIEAAPGPVIVQASDYQQVDNNYAANNYNDNDFYYLPDVGAYYSVNEQLYYYFDGDNWISADCLPGVYRDYDWKYARRFEIREARPYMHNDFYRDRYRGFDNDLAHNHDHFREGFDYHYNRDAYKAPQHFDNRGVFDHRFDNRGGYDQHFDNNGGFDHRFGNNKGNDNHFDNRSQVEFNKNNQQDRFTQNQRGYNGHNDGRRDRF